MSTLLTIIITVMTFFSLLMEAIPLPLKRVEDAIPIIPGRVQVMKEE